MKPTGQPMIAAGRGAPAISISIRWNSAVGALPMATTAPSRWGSQSETAAALRVVPHDFASSGTCSSRRKQRTSLSAGSRPAVMPIATMWASQRMSAPSISAVRAALTSEGWKTRSGTRSTWPVPWTIRTATFSASAGTRSSAASRRIVANDST